MANLAADVRRSATNKLSSMESWSLCRYESFLRDRSLVGAAQNNAATLWLHDYVNPDTSLVFERVGLYLWSAARCNSFPTYYL